MSNTSSARDRDAAIGLAPNRYSPGGSSPADEASCRMARNCRRTRLRTTAGPSARPRANATRGGVELPGGSSTYVHHRTPARARRPSAVRRANARRSRMRQIKPTDGDGPWRGATSARRARPGCSSGDGSRASWHGDGCWVGRCASRSPPRAARSSGQGRQIVHDGAPYMQMHAGNARTGAKTTVARAEVATEAVRSVEAREFASVRSPRQDGCPHDVDKHVDVRSSTGRRRR